MKTTSQEKAGIHGVNRFILVPEAMKIQDAKAAVENEKMR